MHFQVVHPILFYVTYLFCQKVCVSYIRWGSTGRDFQLAHDAHDAQDPCDDDLDYATRSLQSLCLFLSVRVTRIASVSELLGRVQEIIRCWSRTIGTSYCWSRITCSSSSSCVILAVCVGTKSHLQPLRRSWGCDSGSSPKSERKVVIPGDILWLQAVRDPWKLVDLLDKLQKSWKVLQSVLLPHEDKQTYIQTFPKKLESLSCSQLNRGPSANTSVRAVTGISPASESTVGRLTQSAQATHTTANRRTMVCPPPKPTAVTEAMN